jgi:diadenosine tetraphosphate (Ap4A) HIT family hydrolase
MNINIKNHSSPFLNKDKILENEFTFAIYDGFPISKGHSLVIPKRVVSSVFDLDDNEYKYIFLLLKDVKKILLEKFKPDGFNIGINNGADAGQTIDHAHIHIIPRYKGDLKDPRGGVRNILPDNTGYIK